MARISWDLQFEVISNVFENTIVDIHNPQGKRILQVMVESWLNYFNITSIKVDESLLEDITIIVETYIPLLKGRKKQSSSDSIEATVLANIIGSLILMRGLEHDDTGAVKSLQQICLQIMNSAVHINMTGLNIDLIISQVTQQIRDILADDTYDVMEFPLPMKELAEVCTYETLFEWGKNQGKALPPDIQKILRDKQDTLTALMESLKQERIREDRIWNLLNAPMYCNSIKRTLLTLKPRQQVLLAFCYYENQRVSSSDVLEAYCDIGIKNTQEQTDIDQNNIDRNLHYILREVLPSRLAQDFSTSMQIMLSRTKWNELDGVINPVVLKYLDRSSSSPAVDSGKLSELCNQDIGSKRGWLMSKEIIQLCRVLNRE